MVISTLQKKICLSNIAVVIMGHMCGQCKMMESRCIAWRKELSVIWRVHPQTHCDIIVALSGQKPLLLSLRAIFVNLFNKCLENDKSVVKSIICKSNPMSCTGNNYIILLTAKNELTIEGLSVWNEICCKMNDSINVMKEMIDEI